MDHTSHKNILSQYALITTAYWGFTLTDGALRMLVLLHFHTLGYSPLQLASLFLLYEICGIVTNITGGWLGSRAGLNKTLTLGLSLQIVAVLALSFLEQNWPITLSIAFVVGIQGLSGIAKDLTKMSAKSTLKLIVSENQSSTLFKWVSLLTGSKNTLKGIGFFLGGLMLTTLGFSLALWVMAGLLIGALIPCLLFLTGGLGQTEKKVSFSQLFSRSRSINLLSTARFFLFGARDIWFVVALPLFLYEEMDFTFVEVGGIMAAWVIGYGFIQTAAPMIIRKSSDGRTLETKDNILWSFTLTLLPFLMAVLLEVGYEPQYVILIGLGLFGIFFAVNSALHSYLILALTPRDTVAINVGFYYSANAGGRLLGTILSGIIYQVGGMESCLIGAGLMLIMATIFNGILSAETMD